MASANGNVCPLDITDDQVDLEDIMDEEWVDTEARPVDESYNSRLPKLSPFVDKVCGYIAGFVLRRLWPKFKCSD